MPCTQISINESNQAVIPVSFSSVGSLSKMMDNYAHSKNKEKENVSTQIETVNALIDTGANVSCISKFYANKLGLIPSGEIISTGVHGSQKTKKYDATIFIPSIGSGWDKIQLIEVNFDESKLYQAILGMDIISKGTLYVSYMKTCTFCI